MLLKDSYEILSIAVSSFKRLLKNLTDFWRLRLKFDCEHINKIFKVLRWGRNNFTYSRQLSKLTEMFNYIKTDIIYNQQGGVTFEQTII